MNYKGSCHCGQIAFEVEGTLEQAMECNCSHCIRKGYLLWISVIKPWVDAVPR